MGPKHFALIVVASGALMGCSGEGFEGTTAYQGPNSYIAVANDRGRDATDNRLDNAAVAITPDGCQTWYIDDGLEARASNRLDPVSGLPVCNNAAPPGTVLGNYRSGSEGIQDRVPGRPVEFQTETTYEVRTYQGHGHKVHPVSQPHH